MAKYKFKSRDEYVQIMNSLMDNLKYDAKVGGDIAKAKLIIRFVYTEPDCSVTINSKDKPEDPKAYFSYAWEDKATNPDVTMSNTCAYSIRFWQGKENAVLGIATGKLKATGNIAKALALLPVIKPAYKIFPKILKDMGRADLIA